MPDKREQINKHRLEDAPPLLRLVLDILQTVEILKSARLSK